MVALLPAQAEAEDCSYNGSIVQGCFIIQEGIPAGQDIDFFAEVDGQAVACWVDDTRLTRCVKTVTPPTPVFTG